MGDSATASESKWGLPDGFEVLAPFVAQWALQREGERRERRASASYAELLAYYHALQPLMQRIADYFGERAYDSKLDASDQNLFNLARMFMEVAVAVEFYGQPELPQGFPRDRFRVHETEG